MSASAGSEDRRLIVPVNTRVGSKRAAVHDG